MVKKTNYLARVFDRMNGVLSEVNGTNKEVVLRQAAKIARGMKTRKHWKEGFYIYVNLYNEDELDKDDDTLPIRIMKF